MPFFAITVVALAPMACFIRPSGRGTPVPLYNPRGKGRCGADRIQWCQAGSGCLWQSRNNRSGDRRSIMAKARRGPGGLAATHKLVTDQS